MPSPAVKPRSGPAPQQRPSIPFTRASRKRSQLAFDTGALVLSAVASTQINPIQVPPGGFLRYIEIGVTITASNAGAAVTTFKPDAPFSVIQSLALVNSAGDTIIVPVTGYQLFLMNKYGVASEDAPWCDPRKDVGFLVTPGASITVGGNATFSLRVPVEIDPRDAFCAISNSAANKTYNLQIILSSLPGVYGVSPSAGATCRLIGVLYYWAIPNGANSAGTAQETEPYGSGSVSAWRFQAPPLTAGDKLIQLTNVGAVLRSIIFTLRNAAGARIGTPATTDWPAISYFLLNNDPLFYLPQQQWLTDTATSYGYTDTVAFDAAGGMDTGVYVMHHFMDQRGRVLVDGPRDQWLPTVDATLLQLRGTSFGAAAATLEILTNEVRPASAAALYSPNVS